MFVVWSQTITLRNWELYKSLKIKNMEEQKVKEKIIALYKNGSQFWEPFFIVMKLNKKVKYVKFIGWI